MKRIFKSLVVFSILSGCTYTASGPAKLAGVVTLAPRTATDSSELAKFKSDPKTLKATRSFPESFDVMYKRVADQADRCLRGASDLYADQGVGVAFNTYDLSGDYVYWVKIEKEGAGSKVTVYTGNNLAKQKYVDDMFRWASGDTKCTKGWII
ncbi:hypothetical protein [Rhizobium sp. P28RR-XV]|uniref:hypothetical protein n=1 Tax=Rhizobium sp. P28RR-XV TaxID=2726737 RepID=UPI00145706FE|nr:hypothetical protein [Rhizobium sp. P28RR-XV]NLR89444.1 hypothetical protein [Rhizobium sp. P28RR-XV]